MISGEQFVVLFFVLYYYEFLEYYIFVCFNHIAVINFFLVLHGPIFGQWKSLQVGSCVSFQGLIICDSILTFWHYKFSFILFILYILCPRHCFVRFPKNPLFLFGRLEVTVWALRGTFVLASSHLGRQR